MHMICNFCLKTFFFLKCTPCNYKCLSIFLYQILHINMSLIFSIFRQKATLKPLILREGDTRKGKNEEIGGVK